MADLPYRQQQGKEAFSPSHGKEALTSTQTREPYSPQRDSVSPIHGNEGSPRCFNNSSNLKEAHNAKKESLTNLVEGSAGNMGGKKSRIPDIRNRSSPGREVAEQLKTNSASRLPVIGSKNSIPAPSKLPTSPSRIPTAPSSAANSSRRKSSMESLSGEDVEEGSAGGCDPSSTSISPPLALPSSSSSPTRSSSNSLSSSSSSPHKRGREQEIPHSKMRRTSPDGESVSPSKTRRPSPSKIPVAGAYIQGKTPNSSSNEDFMTPKGPQRDPWNPVQVLRPSPSTQSEMFATAPESEGEDWEGGRGGWEEEWGAGEGLAVCEGGEGFVPCEPLPRDPQTQLKKGTHVDKESETTHTKSGSNMQKEYRKENDQTSRTLAANHGASPDRIPQLSWSLSREDTPTRPKDMEPLIPPEDPCFERRLSEDPSMERRPSMSSEDSCPAFRPSQSTSMLPNPSSSGDTASAPHRATQSTSRLPFLPLNNGTKQHLTCFFSKVFSIYEGSSSSGSGSNDSDSSEGGGKRRKNFEVLPRFFSFSAF